MGTTGGIISWYEQPFLGIQVDLRQARETPVRKFYTTTWLALALLPYLFFSMLESFPHQHGEHGGVLCACCQCCAQCGGGNAAGTSVTDANAQPCPLCQVQVAISACAQIIVHTSTPLTFSAAVPVESGLPSPTPLSTITCSRAPPTPPC